MPTRSTKLLDLKNRLTQNLLLVTLIIFALISIYTTKRGLDLVWADLSAVESLLFTWGLALAVGLFMLVLTLKVAAAGRDTSLWRLVAAYLVIALISIFFNFNALYNGMAAKSIERRNLQEIEAEFLRARESAISDFSQSLGLRDKRQAVAALRAELKSEEEHALRPGRGPKYQAIKERHDKAVELLGEAQASLDEFKAELNAIDIVGIGTQAVTYEDYRESTGALAAAFRDLEAKIKANDLQATTTNSEILDRLMDKESLEYSLYTIVTEISKLARGHRQEENTYRMVIAGVLAIIIDIPVFVSLVLLVGIRKPNGTSRHKEDSWKEPLWS